jgi:hypothetical protein
MSETPRTDRARLDEHDPFVAVASECSKLERELNSANQRIKQLENALDCVVVSCSYLHHEKKHQHKYNEPCPIEQLIRKAMETKQ